MATEVLTSVITGRSGAQRPITVLLDRIRFDGPELFVYISWPPRTWFVFPALLELLISSPTSPTVGSGFIGFCLGVHGRRSWVAAELELMEDEIAYFFKRSVNIVLKSRNLQAKHGKSRTHTLLCSQKSTLSNQL